MPSSRVLATLQIGSAPVWLFCVLGVAYRKKLIQIGNIGSHNPLADVIHPSVKPQVSPSQTRCNRRVRAKILELLDHVAFREREQKFRSRNSCPDFSAARRAGCA